MTDRLSQFNRKNIRVLDSRDTERTGKGNTIKMRMIMELEVSTPAELEEMLQNPLSRAMAEKFLSNDPTTAGSPPAIVVDLNCIKDGRIIASGTVNLSTPGAGASIGIFARECAEEGGELIVRVAPFRQATSTATSSSLSTGAPDTQGIAFAVAGFRDDGDLNRFIENLRTAGVPIPLEVRL